MEMLVEKSHTKKWLVLLNACYIANNKGVRKGGVGVNPPLSFIFYKNFIIIIRGVHSA